MKRYGPEENLTGFSITHGAGHNSGIGHDGGIMSDGNFLAYGSQKTLDELYDPSKQSIPLLKEGKQKDLNQYKKAMIKQFGNNIAKDNYGK